MKIVVSYRGAPRIRGWETGAMIARAFRSLGHDTYEYGNIYECQGRLPNAPEDLEDIDLWLYCEMNDGDSQYHEVKNVRARKFACSFYDTSYYPDHLVCLQRYFNFDIQFIANPLSMQYYPNPFHMPYACDPELHFRPLEKERIHALALVGSVRQDRLQFKDYLSRLGTKLDLIKGCFREEYIDTLGSSEIVLNQNPDQGYGLYNMRQFEAPAAGALILTEKRDYEVNEGEFEHMVNCITYSSPQDVAYVVEQLNKYPEEKEKIRTAGQNHVLQHHTYRNRCEEILELAFPHG
jgi:hypothetical protein